MNNINIVPPTLTSVSAGQETVPPIFIRDEKDHPKVPYNQFSNEVPVISFSGIDQVGGRRREEIILKISQAFETWGLFQLVDHGVDTKLMSDMIRFSKEFFALPDDEKLRLDMSDGHKDGKDGFMVSSHLKGKPKAHWREFLYYHMQPISSRDYSRWPDKPEGWREVMKQYGDKLLLLNHTLLQVLSEALGLDKEALSQACEELNLTMAINFYPTCPRPDAVVGLNRHTDHGTITMLLQDQVGGLQVTKDNGETWATIQPIADAFVIFLGDHGHLLCNGKFKSAVHRAVVNSNCSRLSITMFQSPDGESAVYPLKVGEGEKPIIDEPFPYIDMFHRKLAYFRAN